MYIYNVCKVKEKIIGCIVAVKNDAHKIHDFSCKFGVHKEK